MKLSEKTNNIYKGIKHFFEKFPVLFCIVTAFLLNFAAEAFSRHSLWKAVLFGVRSPGAFFFNFLIVLVPLLLSMLFKKRLFALLMISLPFVVLSVSNGFALTYRAMPVSSNDFVKLGSVFGVVNMYFKLYEILLVAAAALLIAWGLVAVYRKCSVLKRCVKKAVISFLTCLAVGALSLFLFLNSGVLSRRFTSLAESYFDYGFFYCFLNSFGMGISTPADYSEEEMNRVLRNILSQDDLVPEKTPNVIFLQLESFMDVSRIKEASFSEDPTPFVNWLKEEYPHGYLTVPCVGAGTVNVEFEVLTGMNLDFFGLGEYPYKTVLQKSTCESLAYNLAENGYTTHAVHNHYGLFYDRAHVFANLGFDTFTCLELMDGVETNPVGWACDEVLTDEINKVMDSTENSDFVFAISVQSHGSYPENEETGVKCTLSDDAPATLSDGALEYYASQLEEVDEFVKELVLSLEERDEETVLVIYGDHIPYFALTNEDLTDGDIYHTEYIIWSNYDIGDVAGEDLQSWELSAYVMEILGMNNGFITKLHQNCSDSPDYMKYLELLQYDMLYGSKTNTDYEPTDIKYGVRTPQITAVKNTGNGAYISGEEFTEYSRVYINGEAFDATEYLSGELLYVPKAEIIYGDSIEVKQTNGKRTIFSQSDEYIAGEEVNEIPQE